MVIDDDVHILDAISMVLSLNGFSVVSLDGTGNIMEAVRSHLPDLVLTDYMMPHLNGGQVCKLIKQNTLTSKIPVILMSAYHKLAMSVAGFGYDAYLSKPFDNEKLLQTIRRLLQGAG